MSWDWYTKKDTNYYIRLSQINAIKKYVDANLNVNEPLEFVKPLPYTYSGGKITMVSMERYKYMSQFKREFTVIRVLLDNGEHIPLAKLRLKHLLQISKLFLK
jgi:hypothetical protein